MQERCSDRRITIQMQRTEQRWSAMMPRLLAAADLERYAASFSGVGGSCQIVGCCLVSSQNEQAEAY
jgi:hypothetical protein